MIYDYHTADNVAFAQKINRTYTPFGDAYIFSVSGLREDRYRRLRW